MRYWIYLVVAVLSISSAFAEDKRATQSISLDQVVVKLLKYNPQLLANDIEAQAAIARIEQAGQSTPITLGVELENFAGSGDFSGDDRLETTLSFARVLELGNKAELRGGVAQLEANLLRNQQDANTLDLLAEAARRYIDIAQGQREFEIAQSKVALAREVQKLVAKRVKFGKSPVAEQRRVKIELQRAELELEDLEHELDTAYLQLSSLWGELSPKFNAVTADLFALQNIGEFDNIVALLNRNPDLTQFATQDRLAKARINLARSRSELDIKFSGGITHFNESSDNALVLSASIPFGSSSRAKPFIEEASLIAQQQPINQQQRYAELYTNLYALYQEMNHSLHVVTSLQENIIPEAKLLLNDYQQGYEAGRYSLIELTIAQRTLLDAQLEAAVTASNYHRYKIDIERLTGSNLSRLEQK